MHCGDQRHLGLCLGYVPTLAYGSCRVSDQGTTLRASDLHNARATILNPFNIVRRWRYFSLHHILLIRVKMVITNCPSVRTGGNMIYSEHWQLCDRIMWIYERCLACNFPLLVDMLRCKMILRFADIFCLLFMWSICRHNVTLARATSCKTTITNRDNTDMAFTGNYIK